MQQKLGHIQYPFMQMYFQNQHNCFEKWTCFNFNPFIGASKLFFLFPRAAAFSVCPSDPSREKGERAKHRRRQSQRRPKAVRDMVEKALREKNEITSAGNLILCNELWNMSRVRQMKNLQIIFLSWTQFRRKDQSRRKKATRLPLNIMGKGRYCYSVEPHGKGNRI